MTRKFSKIVVALLERAAVELELLQENAIPSFQDPTAKKLYRIRVKGARVDLRHLLRSISYPAGKMTVQKDHVVRIRQILDHMTMSLAEEAGYMTRHDRIQADAKLLLPRRLLESSLDRIDPETPAAWYDA